MLTLSRGNQVKSYFELHTGTSIASAKLKDHDTTPETGTHSKTRQGILPSNHALVYSCVHGQGMAGGKENVEALDVCHPHITAFICTVVAAVAARAAARVHKLCTGHWEARQRMGLKKMPPAQHTLKKKAFKQIKQVEHMRPLCYRPPSLGFPQWSCAPLLANVHIAGLFFFFNWWTLD